MKAPRVLIVAGLSVALLATAAGPASAATLSPASADFGRLLIGKKSAPKTFTVTVGSGDRCRSPGPSGDCYPIQEDPAGGGFAVGYNSEGFLDQSSGTCHQLRYLTPSIPSCTIILVFKPEDIGHLNGFVFPNYYDVLGANVTGVGLLSRKSIYCRPVRKGGIYKKNISRWCEKKKK